MNSQSSMDQWELISGKQLKAALCRLTGREFFVIYLRFVLDYEAGESAEVLGCSTPTLHSHWRNAKRKMIKSFNGEYY